MNYELAACRGKDPALWFPEAGEPQAEAKAICATCPEREPCLEENIVARSGIYGGLNAKERGRLRASRLRLEILDGEL